MDYLGFLGTSKRAMYFLKRREVLIMVAKSILIVALLFFFSLKSYSNVLYKNNDLIITDIDLKKYKQLYFENYNLNINNNNALKDLILIKNLLKDLKKNNREFMDKIDNEIILEFGDKNFKNENVRDFLRFTKIRNEFIINYFKNNLDSKELKYIFENIEDLNLPISNNDCLIINKVLNLKNNNEFIEGFFNILKNSSKKIFIKVDKIKYQVCLDQNKFKYIENYIIDYIRAQTEEDFVNFVYDKTSN